MVITRSIGAAISCVLLISSCTTGRRQPASSSENTVNALKEIHANEILKQDLRFEMAHLWVKEATREPDLPQENKGRERLLGLQKKLKEAEAEGQRLRQQAVAPLFFEGWPSAVSYDAPNPYEKIEKLVIDAVMLSAVEKSAGGYTFVMPTSGHPNYSLEIASDIFDADSTGEIRAELECDAAFSLGVRTKGRMSRTGRELQFRLFDVRSSSQRHYFRPNEKTHQCQLRLKNVADGKSYQIKMVTDESWLSKNLNVRKEACFIPRASKMSPAEKVFFYPEFQQMSCPKELNEFRILYSPTEGINEKIKALMGQPLPKEILEKQDPFVELDFSHAPKLKAIYISYLVFRYDFYGALMLRLLEWHARRGVEIKIFTSEVIALDKDRAALTALMRKYPSVKYYEFKYPGRWSRGFGDKFNSLHRTNHIKSFITVSDGEDSENVVIIGGRNIHDGFVFKSAPYYSKYPDLVRYGSGGDEAFVHWMDLEVMVRSRAIALDVARHMYTVFNNDHSSARFQPVNLQVPFEVDHMIRNPKDKIQIRHVLSGPYHDNYALEDFYVQLFSSAQKKIHIVSPYLRLTDKIQEALDRALDRGVKIIVNTRIDLKGDTADLLLTDVNKAAINKLKDKITIYEWIEPGVILHSKLVLVDDEVTFIGGINLNKRSFFHDWENGFLVYSKSVNSDFQKIVRGYIKASRIVSEEQKTKWWTGIFIRMLDDKL